MESLFNQLLGKATWHNDSSINFTFGIGQQSVICDFMNKRYTAIAIVPHSEYGFITRVQETGGLMWDYLGLRGKLKHTRNVAVLEGTNAK